MVKENESDVTNIDFEFLRLKKLANLVCLTLLSLRTVYISAAKNLDKVGFGSKCSILWPPYTIA